MNFLAAIFIALVLITFSPVHAGASVIRGQSGSAVYEGSDAERLVGLLASPDGYVVSQARFALAGMGKEALPALLEALEKREDLVEIIYLLNGIKDARSASALAGLLDLPPGEALDKALSAIFGLGDSSLPSLMEAMDDPARCGNAAKVLSMFSAPRKPEKLYGRLKDKNFIIKSSAVFVLRAWRDKGAAARVSGLLRDASPEVRREASAYFLAVSPDVEAPGIEAMLDDPEVEVRRNALRIAVKERRPGLDSRLGEMLTKDPDPDVRLAAVEAVYRCKAENAGPLFIEALNDKDAAVAAAAAPYAGEVIGPGAAEALCGLLVRRGHESGKVVENVAVALQKSGGEYDPEVLLPYIDWEDLHHVKAVLPIWEQRAGPEHEGIRKALKAYLAMRVDNRYKDRAKTLLERLGG